ncbi:MAG: BlaI/MecI/CopY family transcriptional regulator [Oscillospiraceae bacterium]|nr:BlaI/MecI/CopY family transcriptional regulator [Oscillospiraceae bacterium]MBR6096265.1 BlaI/MecI/CopY family transcriptional regulator [Oscillospiraceae bacterium]
MDYITGDRRLAESDYRLMRLIWDNEPLSSTRLAELAAGTLGWKKSTTYTMIKKMSDKGFVRSEQAVVRSCIPREQVERDESEKFLDRTFSGSLPGFLVAFLGGKKLSRSEAEELKSLIDAHRED